MNISIRDARMERIVSRDVELERLASGFQFTEGPIWHSRDQYLIFSDVPGNVMRRWSEHEGITIFRKPSNMANGNSYDFEGRIVTCEHATSSVTRTKLDGTVEIIASHYDGRELNSPNDIVVKSDGSIYFTDPDFGRREYFGIPRPKELEFQGVYRYDPKAEKLVLLLDDFEQPNGLCFSPDESLLYVNDTPNRHIRVFRVGADGTLSDGRIFTEVTGEGVGVPDGMKTDSEGNVYCTGPGGIHVFDAAGKVLGTVLIPEKTANFTFGGKDLVDVFVTASTSLYRFRVKVPGRAQFESV